MQGRGHKNARPLILDFGKQDNEVSTDYFRLMKMVKATGHTGFIGIEYGGKVRPEDEGIRLTRELLVKAGESA